jgi:hypothetical protein
MIRIEKIHIHEFRGIRDLTLQLDGKNFAACGPNGTGKSGIVDGIEFALTGNISRLSGSGTGGLTVKQHGPHVDSRDKPEQAFVELEVSIPSLKEKRATIKRTVKNASAPSIAPGDQDVMDVFEAVAQHPEFVLSRREIIKYVLSEPGQRSKEVQALLRLDEIEKLRAVLNKISNACSREVAPLERQQREAASRLQAAFNISQLTSAKILESANASRAVLGLAPIPELDTQTSLKDGVASSGSDAGSKIPKIQAVKDLEELDAALAAISAPSFSKTCADALAAVQELKKDPESAGNASRETVLQAALKLFDGEHCPVCGTAWDPEHFKKHVSDRLTHLSAITKQREVIEKQAETIAEVLERLNLAIEAVRRYGPLLSPQVSVEALTAYSTTLKANALILTKTGSVLPYEGVLTAAPAVPDLVQLIKALRDGVTALPEPTKQDAAREFLTVGQERLETYRSASLAHKSAKEKALRAEAVFTLFGNEITKALEEIYKNVETQFTECYRHINREDEGGFTAKLIPSIGKLGFDVDFYGRGHFPPGAYHSEGHQDGMGLCLYLALMRHLLGDGFNFAVLDDVLMSVDIGHRREVCDLLKTKFPNTQFIFTTHDEIWLRHMKSAGLIQPRGFVHFRTWTVDTGPTDWDSHDIWDEIDISLKANKVSEAAAALRRFLEHFSTEACDRLRANVEFRGDAQFMLGDLLPSALAAMKDALKKGKNAANSWNQQEVVTSLGGQADSFGALCVAAGVDQWQVNAAVHYNGWANLQKNDFTPVVEAFRALTAAFYCNKCGEMLRITPDRGTKEALRCACGSTNINLVPK